jgi:hypothetical protein
MNAIETISYKGHEIGIYYDECAESPREWDNLSTIYSDSRSYKPDQLDIDDLMNKIGISEFSGFDDLLKRMKHDYIAYRVCIVDHSCVALSLNRPVPNPYMGFDSGTFGIIAVSKDKVRREYGVKRITNKIREKVESAFKAELDSLEKYMNGEVYGYMVDGGDGDSCWGYYSMDHAIEDAKSIIDCETEAA